jgi:hypothetical protein
MAKTRLVSLPAEAAALSVENAALATLPASLRAPGSLQAAEKRRGGTVLLDPYVKDDDDLPRQARDESNARRFENQKHDAGRGLVFPPHQDATSGTEPGGVYRPPPPVRSAGNGDAPLVDCPAPGLIDCCVSSCCLREASSWRAASSPCFADAIACGKKTVVLCQVPLRLSRACLGTKNISFPQGTEKRKTQRDCCHTAPPLR